MKWQEILVKFLPVSARDLKNTICHMEYPMVQIPNFISSTLRVKNVSSMIKALQGQDYSFFPTFLAVTVQNEFKVFLKSHLTF